MPKGPPGKRLRFIAPPQWRTALRTRADREAALGRPLDRCRHLRFEPGRRDRVTAGAVAPDTPRHIGRGSCARGDSDKNVLTARHIPKIRWPVPHIAGHAQWGRRRQDHGAPGSRPAARTYTPRTPCECSEGDEPRRHGVRTRRASGPLPRHRGAACGGGPAQGRDGSANSRPVSGE